MSANNNNKKPRLAPAGVTTGGQAPRTFYRATDEDVSFVVVPNDLSTRNVAWLISLKEIFSKQLPKMKKEYIISLVFNNKHQSLICFDENQTVVGGITFKPFHSKRFAEIAFCAVTNMVQVRGFGTKLMTHLKEYCKVVNIQHFLTYADNFAIGYFEKQGFSAEISLAKEVYWKEIKHYDDSQLMECLLLPRVNYFLAKELVQAQREILVDKVRFRQETTMSSSGFDIAFANNTDEDHTPVRMKDCYNTIPGLREAGWREPLSTLLLTMPLTNRATTASPHLASKTACKTALLAMSKEDDAAMMNACFLQVWEFIHRQQESWPFKEPVPSSLTVYFEDIAHPIDLSLIRERIVNGAYPTRDALRQDFTLMCDNCKKFNTPDTDYYEAAARLQDTIDEIFSA